MNYTGPGQSPELLSEGLGSTAHNSHTWRDPGAQQSNMKKIPLPEITQPIRGQDVACTQGSTVLEPPLHHFPCAVQIPGV